MYELSTTSADGVSIGEPRSERVQTDLDEITVDGQECAEAE